MMAGRGRPERATQACPEKGSALLIVFVFAAMIAIMLYKEMPVAVFEAQRQKEQLLIDRGDEYKHAVKLYVRKVGSYPPSIDALENTNRVRFLRARYKDPLTGNDDWRLLHAGPGGMLLDSKVNPLPGIGQNPGSSTSGQNSAFGSNTNSASNTNSTASSGFGSGFSSDFGSSSSSSTGQVVVPRIPQRAPAVPANGSTATQQDSSGSWTDPNSLPPVVPTDQAGTSLQVEQPATSTPNQAGAANPAAGNAAQANATQSSAAQAGGGSFNVAAGHPTSTTSTFGRINSGGIAGVASKAQGHSIKKVNDQSDYSLWEFYYDASKDAAQGVAGALAGMGAGAGNRVQQPGGIQTPASDQSSPNQQVSPGVAAPNPAAGPQPGSAPPPSLDNPPPQ